MRGEAADESESEAAAQPRSHSGHRAQQRSHQSESAEDVVWWRCWWCWARVTMRWGCGADSRGTTQMWEKPRFGQSTSESAADCAAPTLRPRLLHCRAQPCLTSHHTTAPTARSAAAAPPLLHLLSSCAIPSPPLLPSSAVLRPSATSACPEVPSLHQSALSANVDRCGDVPRG